MNNLKISNSMNDLIQDSLKSLWIKATTILGGDYFIGNYYSWTKNLFPDWYNRIFNIKIPKENFAEVINNLCKEIRSGLAPKLLLTGADSLPDNIEKVLSENNFKIFYKQTGMAIDLQKIDLNCTADFVGIINNEELIDEWVSVANEAFGKKMDSKIFKLFSKEPDIKFYFCRSQSRIVATTVLYTKGDLAGINFVGTLNAYRGKGIATLLTKKALLDAKFSGCNIGVLQASDMGKRIYENIGFKEYGRISHWEYIGSPEKES